MSTSKWRHLVSMMSGAASSYGSVDELLSAGLGGHPEHRSGQWTKHLAFIPSKHPG